jgi:molecular chaperone HtpG
VKKISSHVTKKVADRMHEIFKDDRAQFEQKWDDLKLFIEYGMISEEKFYEKAEKFALLKNTESKYFTFDEYEKLIKENQTDKDKTLIYLYATDPQKQYSYIEAARNKGYDVLLLDGQLDTHFINHLEQKFKECRFTRVDSDVIDNLIRKEDKKDSRLSKVQQDDLVPVFKGQLPNNASFNVAFESLNEQDTPIQITQSEFMRRMKDMSQLGGGFNFYGDMPDSYNVVINSNHDLIIRIADEKEKKTKSAIQKIDDKINPIKANKEELDNANKGKKDEEISQADKDRIKDLEDKIADLNSKREKTLTEFGGKYKLVKQLIDIALLSNDMLKGEDLSKFVKRSIELL